MLLDQLDLVGQTREVGRQDGCGEPSHAANGTRRVSGLPGEGGDEHAVAPVPMGPQANPGRSARPDRRSRPAPGRLDGGRWHRPPRRFRLAGTCRPSRRVGPPAPADRRGRGDRHLGARELAEFVLAIAPQQLRAPARRPEPRARCVDHDPVERALQRRMLGVLGHDERACARAAWPPLRIKRHPPGMDVGADDQTVAHPRAAPRTIVLPPGAAHASSTRSPGCGSSASTTNAEA